MAVERGIASVLQNMFSGWWGVKSGTTDTAQIGFFTNGAGHTLEQGQEAGGRNQDSAAGLDYSAANAEWIIEGMDTRFSGTGDKTVVSGNAVVSCVRVKRGASALSGDVTIKAGSTTIDTIASGATALTEVDYKGGCRFHTSFIVNFANAADAAKIQVIYRPGDSRWVAPV